MSSSFGDKGPGFCWYTSFLGYPNFFQTSTRGAKLGETFITLAKAAHSSITYSRAKKLFPQLTPQQVETKKAAFQEFGLIYVSPGSDVLSLTSLGRQVLELSTDRPQIEKNRRTILLSLAQGLARYQFYNPLSVGGASKRARARSSDVLPYLVCYYLLHKLDGILTESEFRGAIFGLQRMTELRLLEAAIHKQRRIGKPFKDIAGLPTRKGTASNLKIYFLSHLGLDSEILQSSNATEPYGGLDHIFELTQLGYEVTESVLNAEWKGWRDRSSDVPKARRFESIEEYFREGVGRVCSQQIIESDARKIGQSAKRFQDALYVGEVEAIKELPRREYEEGRKKLVQHSLLERVRNVTLVRDAKLIFKKKHGRFFCEVCEFDFAEEYGARGKDYIEAHHRLPISQLSEAVKVKIDDLALVCSNCHRMLHRTPWITVEELRELRKR